MKVAQTFGAGLFRRVPPGELSKSPTPQPQQTLRRRRWALAGHRQHRVPTRYTSMSESQEFVVANCGQLLTLAGSPSVRRGAGMRELGILHNVAMLVRDGKLL